MRVIVAYPPMFEEIAAAFPTARKPGVIFSWGETLYNPSGRDIKPQLMAHEAVHSQRQGTTDASIREWWKAYINDPAFRLEEELLAHRAEFRAMRASTKDRNARERELDEIARRLASPLYGALLSYRQARHFVVVTPGG